MQPFDYTDVNAQASADLAKRLLVGLIPGGAGKADEIGRAVDAIVAAAVAEGAARSIAGIRSTTGVFQG